MTEKKANWFARVVVILLCSFLLLLVVYRFFFVPPAGELGGGLLVVLAMLVVLALSESFDRFSIGQLLTMGREVQRREAEVSSLRRENAELRSQVVSVATSVSQRQASTNTVTVFPESVARLFSVTEAPEAAVAEKRAEEHPQAPAVVSRDARSFRLLRAIEEKALQKFLDAGGLGQFPAMRQARLTSQFEGVDPISVTAPIFDAFVSTVDFEVFVEFRFESPMMVPMLRDRLYLMLSKIHHYRTLKKVNAHLVLVLATRPGEEAAPRMERRLRSEFEPAIANGLLRIEHIEFTDAELADLQSSVAPAGNDPAGSE